MSHHCKETALRYIIRFPNSTPTVRFSINHLGLGAKEQEHHLLDLINHSLSFYIADAGEWGQGRSEGLGTAPCTGGCSPTPGPSNPRVSGACWPKGKDQPEVKLCREGGHPQSPPAQLALRWAFRLSAIQDPSLLLGLHQEQPRPLLKTPVLALIPLKRAGLECNYLPGDEEVDPHPRSPCGQRP